MLAIALICATLAVYRLSFMITREEGPFDVFERLRLVAQALPSSPDGRPNWIARGIACPLCVSFWLSLIAAVAVTQAVGISLLAIFGLWPAIAGGCLFLFQIGGT